jgi:hypothetical protein
MMAGVKLTFCSSVESSSRRTPSCNTLSVKISEGSYTFGPIPAIYSLIESWWCPDKAPEIKIKLISETNPFCACLVVTMLVLVW